jgi:hypothetical protein
MQAKLIVTIDTEEEGLWSGKFSGYDNPVDNLTGVPRFQAICDRYGVKPTYLVDSPVVTNPEASAILEPIVDDGRCEIGCHIHPWNTPPEEDDTTSERSYLCNLPLALQRQKLTTITNQIESRFGRRPTSFRAGRYGMGDAGVGILRELGYIVDSSVCPYMDYSEDGGPDFRSAQWRPYFIDQKLLEPANRSTGLLEVPVSFGFNWTNFDIAHRLDEFLSGPAVRRFRIKGILERAGVLRKIKFSPEKASSGRLATLANAYMRQNAPCLVMMFHSSSLKAGYSPYVTNEAELDRFLATIGETLEYCLGQLGMCGDTLTGFATEFVAEYDGFVLPA